MSPLYMILREANIHYKTRIKPIVIGIGCTGSTYEPVTEPRTVLTFNTVEDKILATILLKKYSKSINTLTSPAEVEASE